MKIQFKKITYERKKSYVGFLMIAPWFAGFVYFFLIPFVYSFIYSVCDVKIGSGGMSYKFVGLANYISAFTVDSRFLPTLVYSLQNMAFQIPLVLVFSLFLAILMNTKFRGRLMVRGIFFLPVIIASGIIINILKYDSVASSLMSGSRSSGLFQGIHFQELLYQFGLPVSIIKQLMLVINGIFELVWKSGVQTVLFLAGLQSVPRTVYEASEIEGATAWETFWKVTVPIMSPIIVLCMFYTIVDNSTDYSNQLIRYIRENAQFLKMSYSSMLSCVWFAIVMAIVAIAFYFTRKRVYFMDDRG